MEIKQQKRIKNKIKSWMILNGISGMDVSNDLGYSPNAGAVSHFLIGRITSQKMREYFLGKGCPPRLLEELDKLRKESVK